MLENIKNQDGEPLEDARKHRKSRGGAVSKILGNEQKSRRRIVIKISENIEHQEEEP